MSFTFNDGEREKLYAKIAMIGASGSGKTVSALKIAFGLTGDWKKIAVADTENKRSLAYIGTSHTGLEIGSFKHAPMYAPYTTDIFSQAIDAAVNMGAEVLIIDSFSHEWEGLGGVTHAAEEAGGEFWHWKGPKIAHRRLVDKIQQAPIHIITTIRTKQEYAVIPGGGRNGKNSIEKLGMKPVQSNDLDYEFLLAFHVNEDHEVVAKKDNTGLFGREEFQIEVAHGEKLKAWLVEGKEVKTVAEERKEVENRRKFILNDFSKRAEASEAFHKWVTQLEIKHRIKIGEFPTETLETLYQKIVDKEAANKQQEAPSDTKPEEPKVTDTQTEESVDYITGITRMIAEHDEIKEMYDEYMSKMKVTTLDGLKENHQKVLFMMCERRKKTIEEGEGVEV